MAGNKRYQANPDLVWYYLFADCAVGQNSDNGPMGQSLLTRPGELCPLVLLFSVSARRFTRNPRHSQQSTQVCVRLCRLVCAIVSFLIIA